MQPGQAEFSPPGYHQYWYSAEKKGYSGTAVFTRMEPLSVRYGIGKEEHSHEGRAITLEFEQFFLVNVYTPNSQNELARLPYRMQWEDDLRAYLCALDTEKPVVYCGDLNVAHREIDLKNPKQNIHSAGFSYEELVAQFAQIRKALLPRIINAQIVINQALDAQKQVLFEGAQAAMLDINYGNYPYVTSSSPTSAGVCTGAGVSPKKLDVIIGIAKAYSTRVGEGPFVSELFDDMGAWLREQGHEFGATTGRPRRCGWLDVNVVRHAAMINGLSDLVITKLDILSGLKKIRMCVAYDIDGVRYDYIPSSMEELQRAKPIYEEFDGWQEDISTMKTYEELPENCKIYLRRIEELCNTRISMISVGPERNCNIYLHEMLK